MPQYICNTDHQWIDVTTLNEGPARRYLCAACYAVRTEQPACIDPPTEADLIAGYLDTEVGNGGIVPFDT